MKAEDFINAISILEKERGIPKDVVVESLKEALEKAYKKNYDTEADVEVIIDTEAGEIRLYEKRIVVDNLDDEETEIFIEEAQDINPDYKIGDIVVTEVDMEEFGRLAAVHAKQVVRQKIREAEKTMVYDEYVHLKDDIIVGTIDRVEANFAIIDLGKTAAILPITNQIQGERLYAGSKIKVYVLDVDKAAKGAQVVVSRSDQGFIRRLFEAEVPDVYDGSVVIKSIAREAGDRAKMSVYATKDGVDAIGACIGPRGSRVQAVSDEVNGEKIDIIKYDEDPVVYITNTLAPSKVISVNYNDEARSAIVVVPDDQLSLAIGKKGQNVRLSVRLTGFKIDIKSLSDAIEQGIPVLYNGNVDNEVEKSIPKPRKNKNNVDLPVVSLDEFEDFDEIEEIIDDNKPVVDIETLLKDIREASPVKKVKIKKEVSKVVEENTITFLDMEKPKEAPVVPIYSEAELAAIKAEEAKEQELEEEFYDDIDYDEYDKYYD
ncbi:MAG: transcription termination factor NusA [Bacilli bacterium]